MTTTRTNAPQSANVATDAVETPWYDLIDDPEPPEDAMQQDDTILDVMSILKARYENDPSTLMSEQTNVIYNSEVPGSVVAPDGYIVFGLETDSKIIKRDRRSYRIDEWGPSPAFVLEVASESAAHRDLSEKREIYAGMGAQEYWRLDRRREYYGEPLVGERLVNGEYVRFALHIEDNGDIWSRSEVLGVDFYYRAEDESYGEFFLRDSATGEWLNTLGLERALRQDAEAKAQEATAKAREAEVRAREAEARNRELQAELKRLQQREE